MVLATGWLGTRGSWMLDFVAVAMLVVLPVLAWSVFLAKVQGRYLWHKRIQLALAGTLLVTIALFEYDMRMVTDWRSLASHSPYWNVRGVNVVAWALGVHLSVAVPTAILWIVVVVGALRGFGHPPRPTGHSRRHRTLGWAAVTGMALTAVTGWIFYWMAFVA
ncbi:MAG: hypothetical protein KatS3mg110_3178 [Pirellulaceae bacterium]|nr:MAG: hypothetical protein KatS3mg110_3178 [Pirellulaceae bacterium]